MAKQPKHDEAVEEIKALEDRRYRAMLAGNTVVLDELCADDLIYTHSKANFDDKLSYLHKSPRRERTFVKSINIGDVKDHPPPPGRAPLRRLGDEVEIAHPRSKTGE